MVKTENSTMKKFLQSIDDKFFEKLEKSSEKRGISVQELIRAIIIPEWYQKND